MSYNIEFNQLYLDLHNKYRALHGVPAMEIDEKSAIAA